MNDHDRANIAYMLTSLDAASQLADWTAEDFGEALSECATHSRDENLSRPVRNAWHGLSKLIAAAEYLSVCNPTGKVPQ